MRFEELPTPCYVVDEALIEKNLEILQGVAERTGAKILLAQKAFSNYALYPLIGQYLSGATASGLYEARLGMEEMILPLRAKGKLCENHIFSPAYREEDFDEILKCCDHIVFNSWKQVEKFGLRAKECGKQIGLRINPECSTQEGHAIYDPCAPGSRLGVTFVEFAEGANRRAEVPEDTQEAFAGLGRCRNVTGRTLLELLDGLHFHTLCEQDADALEVTLDAVERKFGSFFKHLKWLNFGGGHHITRPGYDIERLERCIKRVQDKYGLKVYLEPGEAVALNAGFLVTTVLETAEKSTYVTLDASEGAVSAYAEGMAENTADVKMNISILDTSAACHMPDVLEMPYRPPLQGSGEAGEKAYTYRLGGPTCLAGDVIGDYSFDHELQEGERLVFEDMAIYSMVKNNTFNGMPLPAIAIRDKDGDCRIWKQFGYEDFKERL
ncbi:MAG: carboxynorspermidine decarboxylase [Lachnospiraceae bacterium]|nr:carboxynorspermidine decarboxylase [Lachnospiraceae bacterium]